ncbi:hypothetical protein MC885_006129, partial [Smutsia gigantea]
MQAVHCPIWHILLLIIRIVLLQSAKMNLMDITRIFSLLQPDKEEEDTNMGEKQALNQAVYNNDSYSLDELFHQEHYKRFINTARDGAVAILQELLGHGAEANVKAKLLVWASNIASCSGPLYLAAVYGHLDCFRLLLLHGADPDYNCTDQRLLACVPQPRTLLEIYLHHNCGPEYIQLLIDFGADIYLPFLCLDLNSKDDRGTELLLHAR